MLRTLQTLLLASCLSASSVSLADGNLPASLIRIPESVTTVFIAETSTAKFHRFERSDDGIVHSGSFYMSIGEEGPGKKHSGDKRTPIGVYFVKEQLDTSKLHDKYGVTAFPLDYPNAWDQQADRDGEGIWVHGVDPQGGERPERDTDGCIALANQDLKTLAAEFEDNVTPVLVTREVDWHETSDNHAIRNELENRIAEWAASKEEGDLFTFLSLYDKDFERWGMDKSEWSILNLQSASQRAIYEVILSELLLLAYPDEEGLYLSRFRQTVNDGEREIVSTARLYWRRDKSGALKIIAEDNG
jgi:murein L,D-transpeptidase YafK